MFWSTVCSISSKILRKRASVHKLHYQNPNMRLDLQYQKTIFLLITLILSLHIQIDKFFFHFDLKTTYLAPFPSKSLNYTAIIFFLKEIVKRNPLEIHHLYKKRCYASFIHFTKKYRRNFWTKLTYIVVFITTFSTFSSPSIE